MNLLESRDLKLFLKSIKKNENIVAVILFGSYSQGKQKSFSDIDICLIPKDGFSILDLDYPLRDEGFDIISFYNLNETLKYEILTKGKILILNNKAEFMNIKRRFLREYLGFGEKREYYYKKIIENA